MSDRTDEEILIERRQRSLWNTLIGGIAGTLCSALLIWVAASQLNITTETALLNQKLEQQETLMTSYLERKEEMISNLLQNQNNIWPRLRTHGENIQVLKREIERMCDCQVELKQPERF